DAALLNLGGFHLDARIVRSFRRAPRASRLRGGEEALRTQREQLRHRAGPEREADDMGTIKLQRIEQAWHVKRLLAAILLRVVRLAAPARAAGVERADAKILLQIGDEGGPDPTFQGGGAAMQQHDRLALAAVDIVDLHAVEIGELALVGGERWLGREAHERSGNSKLEFHRAFPLAIPAI